MPIEFEHKTLQIALELDITLPAAKLALHNIELISSQRKQWHEKFIKEREFSIGDWCSYMIHDINITKENFRLDGLVPMKSLQFLTMEQFNYQQLIRSNSNS